VVVENYAGKPTWYQWV